jgi:hypothetical protein
MQNKIWESIFRLLKPVLLTTLMIFACFGMEACDRFMTSINRDNHIHAK